VVDDAPPPGDEHAPPDAPWEVSYTSAPTSIESVRRRRNGSSGAARVPPHDLDAEEALLGAMLLSGEAIDQAQAAVSARDFYKPAHGLVYAAIVDLHGKGAPADPVTVADVLRRDGTLDGIGGGAGLVSLQANTPAISNAPRYAAIVARCAVARRYISAAGELAEKGYASDIDGAAGLVERAGTLTRGGPGGRPLERSLVGSLVSNGVPAPTMVHDWLYAGGLHSLQAEPEAGKSWLALQLSLEVMEGYSVIYLDEEGGEELVAERLAALGGAAAAERIDQRFFYFPFPERAWSGPEDVAAFAAVVSEAQAAAPGGLGLVVLDSLPDFLEAAGKDEDKSRDVTEFVKRFLKPLREPGAALLVLDHLVKPDPKGERKRGRYARGSGAKLAKSHLTLLLEVVEPFDRTTSGQVRLFRTKDRRGAVPLPRLGTSGLLIDVKVEKDTVAFVPRTTRTPDIRDAIITVLSRTPDAWMAPRALWQALRETEGSWSLDIVTGAAENMVGHEVQRRGRPDRPRYGLARGDPNEERFPFDDTEEDS
jgi:hypothetical protein